MFTTHDNDGKHEVDHPDTKATNGLYMVIKRISVKIVRASCILSVKLSKRRERYIPRTVAKRTFWSPVSYFEKQFWGIGEFNLIFLLIWDFIFLLATCIVQVHTPPPPRHSVNLRIILWVLCKASMWMVSWGGHAPSAWNHILHFSMIISPKCLSNK